MSECSVTRVLWHARLNQIVVGDSKGDVSVFYSPKLSARGALLCISKAPKRVEVTIGTNQVGLIVNPHALPLFKDGNPRSQKRKLDKMRKDPVASHKPGAPSRPTPFPLRAARARSPQTNRPSCAAAQSCRCRARAAAGASAARTTSRTT